MSLEITQVHTGTQRRPYVLAALLAAAVLAAYIWLSVTAADERILTLVSDIGTPLVVGLVVAAMLAAFFVTRRQSVRLARFWLICGLSLLFLCLGEATWAVLELQTGEIPYPSIADVFYLLSYPFFLIAIFTLPRLHSNRLSTLKTLLDMLIVLLAALIFLWNFIMGPLAAASGNDPLLQRLLSMAYPAGDLVQMVALMVLLYHLPFDAMRRPLLLVALGCTGMIVFDSWFSWQTLQDSYSASSIIVDSGYIFCYLLFGLGAVWQVIIFRQGAQAEPVKSRRPAPAGAPVWLFYLPYLWVVATYLLLLNSHAIRLPMSPEQLTWAVGGITVLVIFRQIVVIQENAILMRKVQVQTGALEEANQELQVEIGERIRAEEQLTYEALHDALTGLPNRAYFLKRLATAALAKRGQPDFEYSVLFLDLDGFKVVNDSLGHANGDRILRAIAELLPACVRAHRATGGDVVARLGGDEFVILLEDMRDPELVIQVADRIQQELSKPIMLDGARVFISVSMGVVINVDPAISPEDILRDADLAMYQAKDQGKARYQIFEPGMRRRAIQRMSIENEMRRGLEQNEFRLYYQPIVHMDTRQPAGFEALVRWQHPARGLLSPGEFIPMAEESGLIIPLGRWIMDEASRQLQAWRVAFPQHARLNVSVNISGNQLRQPNFPTEVARALEKSGLPAENLVLEITENAWYENPERINRLIRQLKTMGVECEIDDFGTGYSSMTHLRLYPITCAKIDRSFIKELDHIDSSQPSIVRGMVALLNDLGIRTVAEGIETASQYEALRQIGCQMGQGYWLGYPMPVDQATEWLATLVVERVPAKFPLPREGESHGAAERWVG